MKEGEVSLHAMKACGTAEVYLHAFLASALDGGVNFTPRPLYPRKRNQVPTEQDTGCAPETVWAFWRREKSLDLAGIRSLDYPAHILVTILTELSRFKLISTRI